MEIIKLCRLFGYSKQAYYKRLNATSIKDYSEVKSLVIAIRCQLPRCGGRKLYYMICNDLKVRGIKMGGDKLFSYLRTENLLFPKKKNYHTTTNSKHWMRKYPNKLKNLEIHRPEQVWVADKTYLQVQEKHYYLHLLTDAYSKRLVGYSLSNNMKATTTLKALNRAIKGREYKEKLIHHSDRGLQYCISVYTKRLLENNMDISMTEESDPYKNAVAERINGILKAEFGLDDIFKTYELLELQVIQSIALYNQLRPHMSINLLTPNEAHKQMKIKT